MTFTASYDRNFIDHANPEQNGFFSAGIHFNYDQAGDSRLDVLNIALTGTYTQSLSKNAFLSGGIQLGLGQRNFRTDGLSWDNQWNGDSFDPNLPPREPFDNQDRVNFGFVDLGAGINLHLQSSNTRSKIDLGVGAFHLNTPQHSFYDDPNSELPTRLALNAQGVLQIAEKLDLMVNGLHQMQDEYQETVLSGLINIHVSTKTARQVQVALGVGLRTNDAFFPQASVAYDGWRVGFSYDVNTSPFEAATDRRGGPEFSIVYTIKAPRPLLETKNCRIF